MRKREDPLSEAIARLKREGQSADVPKEIVDETLRRMAEGEFPMADSDTRVLPVRPPPSPIRNFARLAAAAGILVLCGYVTGRLSAPKPLDLDELREALAPSVAAALEPGLRKRVVEEIRQDYQLALAGTYVRVKEELTEQYRNDLNRFALQTLAASNAVTNELLTQVVQSIDTAQTQDLRRIVRVLSEIEMNREQDKTQLASGLQTLAYRTDELSRTNREIAQLVAARPAPFDVPQVEPRQTPEERNQP
jgi:hypothetical protein